MTLAREALHAEIVAVLEGGPIIDARDEADRILAAVGEPGDREWAMSLAQQRAAGAPLAYVLGRQRFMGIDLFIAPGALVPREETELLGQTAVRILEAAAARDRKILVIDMCCGSGNLACGIAHRLPQTRLWACDLTDGCVSVARRNVAALGLEERVTVEQGDLFAPLAGQGLEGTIDVIVCNPPYISTGRLEKDRAELLVHEPREAFDGGPYGLSIHQRVIREAPQYLSDGGHLLFEFGLGQERQLKILFDRTGTYHTVQFITDHSGAPRVALAEKKAEANHAS